MQITVQGPNGRLVAVGASEWVVAAMARGQVYVEGRDHTGAVVAVLAMVRDEAEALVRALENAGIQP